jgi:hypothetical protein
MPSMTPNLRINLNAVTSFLMLGELIYLHFSRTGTSSSRSYFRTGAPSRLIKISGLGSPLDLLLNELTCPLFDLLVFAHLYWMFMNPQMQAGSSHISRSIYIIDSGSTSCKIDRWNLTDLTDKCQPSRCGLPNRNCRHSESIPFLLTDRGGAMNAGSVFAILILTTEVAYTC